MVGNLNGCIIFWVAEEDGKGEVWKSCIYYVFLFPLKGEVLLFFNLPKLVVTPVITNTSDDNRKSSIWYQRG